MFYYILVINLINIKDNLESSFSLNLKVNIILSIFYYPELLIGYNISIKTKNINNILK